VSETKPLGFADSSFLNESRIQPQFKAMNLVCDGQDDKDNFDGFSFTLTQPSVGKVKADEKKLFSPVSAHFIRLLWIQCGKSFFQY
jgi:hypothetical protein